MTADPVRCHICESVTDYYCRDCGEPVCEECCVPMTIHNQIDYTLCNTCEDWRNARRHAESLREYESEKTKKAIKEKREATRRANWYKPENVAKRAKAKEEKRKEKADARRKQAERNVKILSDIFRMFR